MAELPREMRQFAYYLNGLVQLVGQDGGWCREFWQRDPDGMRACLEGQEVPPWDVVESLLQDLATVRGVESAQREVGRARGLHEASVRAFDGGPGARERLAGRLELLQQEQQRTARRLWELHRFAETPHAAGEPQVVAAELAWARDDYERTCSRVAELRGRLAVEPVREREQPDPLPEAVREAKSGERRRRPRGSARFAGVEVEDESDRGPTGSPAAVPAPRGARFAGAPAEVLSVESPLPGARIAAPRGARFAGAPDVEADGPVLPPLGEADRQAVAGTVVALRRLRSEGHSGQAHAALVAAAQGPAARFPLLAEEFERAGLRADWATLLWEAAALPPERVLAVTEALAAGGRGAEAEQVLRQGMARPAAELGRVVAGLVVGGRTEEARAVLDACVRSRGTKEAARLASADPNRLVPLLLDAGRRVSAECHEELTLALRLAGVGV